MSQLKECKIVLLRVANKFTVTNTTFPAS